MNRRIEPSPLALGALVAALAAGIAAAPGGACDSPAHARPAPTVPYAWLAPPPAPSWSDPSVPLWLCVAPTPAPVAGGLVAHRDPETGLIGGMPAAAPGDFVMMAPEGLGPTDLVEEALPGGGVRVNLRGLFQEYAVLTFDAAGRPVFRCGPDPRALVAAPAPHAPVVEE
uniref:Uncharacterized protein n=1 Tax=Eiseniibacteriota bacterium TaxID=2212470 RepID=A0A832MLK5_UNCEI